MRGIYNTSGEDAISTVQDLAQALNTDLRKDDLADFFYENRAGKLSKTKAIYMIYPPLFPIRGSWHLKGHHCKNPQG